MSTKPSQTRTTRSDGAIAAIVVSIIGIIIGGWLLAELRPGLPIVEQLFGGGRFVLTTLAVSIIAFAIGRRRSGG
jgi:hypothetical protein